MLETKLYDKFSLFLQRKTFIMKTLVKIALLCLVVLATSCAARKKVVKPPKTFEWMTSNLDIQAEGNGLSFNNLSGQIRMRKDSLVWLNITATMGVEVMRAKFTNDSVWITNRMEKTYLAEPMDTLAALTGLPLSLPLIETLLLDNNKGLPPVEDQTVLLKTFIMGNLSAKMKYKNIKLDEKTSFPMKISEKWERIKLKRKP
jgi:hypothetical protein